MFRKIFTLLGVVAVLAVILNCQGTSKSTPIKETSQPDPWEIKQLLLNQATAYLIRGITEGLSVQGIDSVTVTDLLDLEGNPTILGRQLAEDFFTNLDRSKKFNKLVERRLLETILREQNIQLSDLIDPATAARIGRLCGADGIVTGTLNEGPAMIRVNIRLLATETAECLSSANVDVIKDEQVAEWIRRVGESRESSSTARASRESSVSATPAMSEDGTKYFGYVSIPNDWRGSSRLMRLVSNTTFYNKAWLEYKPVVLVKRGADLDFMPGEENTETTMFIPPGITVWCLVGRTGPFDAVTEGYDSVPPYPSLGKKRTHRFCVGPGEGNTVLLGGL